ncbi:MAG TPA: sortase [Actinomycetota bacterium]|nr:sortase [Actinomycetota bacterium]
MRIVRYIGLLGRLLVGAGLVLLFYTTYLLWGTGVETKRTQAELSERLRAQPVVPEQQMVSGEIPPARPAQPVALGEPLWTIVIPKIGLRTVVVNGVGVEELKKGPGHFPDCAAVPEGVDCIEGSPFPGESGNVAISGHRTTYTGPFYRLDELAPGDEIYIESGPARYRYVMDQQKIVSPREVDVVLAHGRDELTLTTCHPRFSAAQRLIVHAAYLGAEPIAGPPQTGAAPDRREARAEVPAPPQPIPNDVFVLAGVALLAFLGAMFLTDRLRRTAAWSTVTIVAAAALWTGVFPQVLRLMPPNY